MPRFAANLSMLYPELALCDRVAAAARDGFAAVEIQSPYEIDATELRRALRDARVALVLINAPAGNAAAGERGLGALPGREKDFDAAVRIAVDYAAVCGTERIHLMAGVPAADEAEADRIYQRNLAEACRRGASTGAVFTIEPINRRDFPGYYLTTPQQAAAVIAGVGAENLRLQFDCYHVQVAVGDLTRQLQTHFPLIGHIQIADAPGRHEPGTGEINFAHLFCEIDRLGYRGWVGCEYRPAAGAAGGGTSAALGWMRRW